MQARHDELPVRPLVIAAASDSRGEEDKDGNYCHVRKGLFPGWLY